jgi:hypothetical protein
MEQGYVVLSIVRLGLLLFSFFVLPLSILMLKTAWQMNDQKKIRRGIMLLWGSILAGFLFIKMFGGTSCGCRDCLCFYYFPCLFLPLS